MTLLPTLILNTQRRDTVIGNRDYFGYALWTMGFLFEVVADMQKSIFRANPNNDVRKIEKVVGVIDLFFSKFKQATEDINEVTVLNFQLPVLPLRNSNS